MTFRQCLFALQNVYLHTLPSAFLFHLSASACIPPVIYIAITVCIEDSCYRVDCCVHYNIQRRTERHFSEIFITIFQPVTVPALYTGLAISNYGVYSEGTSGGRPKVVSGVCRRVHADRTPDHISDRTKPFIQWYCSAVGPADVSIGPSAEKYLPDSCSRLVKHQFLILNCIAKQHQVV